MDVEKDEFRNVVDDARARHAAVVALIYFTDQQAMALLRLYVTLGIATASGAAAALAGTFIPRSVGWGLGAATFVLIIGAWLCIRAMRSREINLPGRGPDFWLWALRSDVSRADVLKAYLENLAEKTKKNAAINLENGKAFQYAKVCSLLTPAAALIGTAVAMFLSR